MKKSINQSLLSITYFVPDSNLSIYQPRPLCNIVGPNDPRSVIVVVIVATLQQILLLLMPDYLDPKLESFDGLVGCIVYVDILYICT